MAADEPFLTTLNAAWELAASIEPALGTVVRAQWDTLADAMDQLAELQEAGLEELAEEEVEDTEAALAALYLRAAAVAIAAGEEAAAHRWFDDAEALSDEAQLAVIEAARKDPERFRALVHGRNLMARGSEKAARAIWKQLAAATPPDAIAETAAVELAAPRPLREGQMPSLWSYNGFGLGFAGSRDRWDDGSYATTQCITALWIPLFPIGAYRVAPSEDDGYYVLAREQLSKFAIYARRAILGITALAIVALIANSVLNDPARLARGRWDDTLAAVAKEDPEAALRRLDGVLTGADFDRVDSARAQRAGAEVVRKAASLVAKPFDRAGLDQATRVVRRYEALPERARAGVARDAILVALDGWLAELGDAPPTADARLVLLRHAANAADARRSGPIAAKITAARLAVADAATETAPLEALAILLEEPHAEAVTRATKIVARLVESPSLLLEAGADLDKWLGVTSQTDALHVRVVEQRTLAEAGRTEATAEGVTVAQLTAMAAKRPWDQHVVLGLANQEANAGKLDPAAQRLRALGAPAMMIRDARLLLGQLASAQGQLEEADALLTGLLGARLQRFAAASAAYQEAVKAVQQRLDQRFKTGDLPFELIDQLQRGSVEDQRAAAQKWYSEQIDADPAVQARQAPYLALSDIVAVSLAAGSVKLRRAQAMSGAAQAAMLEEAERTFLAIRTEAEGQPSFRLGLGEIYARLGKTAESEAEFTAVLAEQDPELSLQVSEVYRSIGSVARAKEVATGVHKTATDPRHQHAAATTLGLLSTTDEEAEGWYRKGDQSSQFVKMALLEIEGRKLLKAGKPAECAAKFALVAKTYMASANKTSIDDFNNAAIAHQQRFLCSGDLRALADAEAAFERAYRARSDHPILVGNLASVLESNGELRVLARRIDAGAMRLSSADADTLLQALLDSPEREAVLADLAAEPGVRRSAELLAQFEVLAPNNPAPYRRRFARARALRDVAAAEAIVERVKKAKALDVSEAAVWRARWLSGEGDTTFLEEQRAALARVETALAQPKVSAKTRAALLYLQASALADYGVYASDVPALERSRKAALEAMKLWPALQLHASVARTYLDEAGLAADAATWIKLRRARGAAAVLDKLVAEASPLAAKIRGSRQWSEALAHARADTTRPSTTDLRLARLFGDAALEARAKPVLDDRLQRLDAELDLLFDPKNEAFAEELAYFDRR